MNEDEILAPCPECGSTDVFYRIAMTSPVRYSAKCNFCSREIGFYDTKEETTQTWNQLPLSLAALRRMQGEKVWVRDQGGKGRPVCGTVQGHVISFPTGSCVWLDENAGDVKCGSWWFAYRYKPQGN